MSIQQMARRILATDLDGTLVPLDLEQIQKLGFDDRSKEICAAQWIALAEIKSKHAAGELELIYVTGRYPRSAIDCIQKNDLPAPTFLICNVGTSIVQITAEMLGRVDSWSEVNVLQGYEEHLLRASRGVTADRLDWIDKRISGLRLQELPKQGRFKRSYYCDSGKLDALVCSIESQLEGEGIAYQVVPSLDPFNGLGLIDLLPQGVDKGSALRWWASKYGESVDLICYAGDSGNDLAALISATNAIIVSNASSEIKETVLNHHHKAKSESKVYVSDYPATSGVLDGCRRFGL